GNSTQCSFEVTISEDEAPTIACTDDITQTADAGACGAALSIAAPAVNDNCAVASVINDFNGTNDASDTYPVGTTTVIWTVTDIHGNSTQCSFEVTISDDEDPTITCTSDI